MRPLLVGGGVSEGVIGSCLIATAPPLIRPDVRKGVDDGEGDGDGVLIPTTLPLTFCAEAAAAAFVFAVFASLSTV